MNIQIHREAYIGERLKEAENLKRYFSPKQYNSLIRKIKSTNGFTFALPNIELQGVTYENTTEQCENFINTINKKEV